MRDEISYDRYIFAANLKRLMQRSGERQVDIARVLGVSKATVSAYCSAAQMPRMDKIEQLSRHFGVSRAELIEAVSVPPSYSRPEPRESGARSPAEDIYDSLNDAGQEEFIRYGRYLRSQPEYRAKDTRGRAGYIKHFLVPAATGYASPIEGEDYELIERGDDVPPGADFCISVSGDSMEPYIRDGELVYVRRGAELSEFDAGIFYVDGDVFCKQWCTDYSGTLHLLSANAARQDANITIPRSANRSCVCFGKVLLPVRLPKPLYW